MTEYIGHPLGPAEFVALVVLAVILMIGWYLKRRAQLTNNREKTS